MKKMDLTFHYVIVRLLFTFNLLGGVFIVSIVPHLNIGGLGTLYPTSTSSSFLIPYNLNPRSVPKPPSSLHGFLYPSPYWT